MQVWEAIWRHKPRWNCKKHRPRIIRQVRVATRSTTTYTERRQKVSLRFSFILLPPLLSCLWNSISVANLILGVHPHCKAFVQTTGSNWNRLINEIRKTDGRRRNAASIDLEPGEWRKKWWGGSHFKTKTHTMRRIVDTLHAFSTFFSDAGQPDRTGASELRYRIISA